MAVKRLKKWMRGIFFTFMILYAALSLLVFKYYHSSLSREYRRIYRIADHLELWKSIVRANGGYYDPKLFASDERRIKLRDLTNPEEDPGFLKKGDKYYAIIPAAPLQKREEKLERYFSDQVFGRYFYITTDKTGKVQDMFWGRP